MAYENANRYLSVEARVKAHISTPYINADGRGVVGAYARDTEVCMLDPQRFRELETKLGEEGRGGGGRNGEEEGGGLNFAQTMMITYGVVAGGPAASKRALALAEEAKANVAARAEHKSESIRASEAHRLVEANAATYEEMSALLDKRDKKRDAEREADANAHFLLYQQRNASERAQRAFDESLKPSVESIIRDREESVSRRHRELLALREHANTSQEKAIEYDAARKEAALALGAETLERKLSEQAAAERKELEEKAKAEYESIVSERKRQTELRRFEDEIRMKEEVQSMLWARQRDVATAEAQRASDVAQRAAQDAHEAELSVQEALATRSYQTMKALHAKLEDMCRALSSEINKVNRSGSCLNMLMLVAKEKAVARGLAFSALCRVCDATFAPTVYTPSVFPRPDAAKSSSSVSTQTIISEPIRPVSQQRGRRI